MLRLVLPATLLLSLCTSAVHGGTIPVTFSGGNGTPLTITFSQAATYVVTTAPPGPGSVFVLEDTGNVLASTVRASTGSITYKINNGSPITIDSTSTGNAPANDITALDFFLFKNSPPNVVLGDVLTVTSGSVTTNSNVLAAPPASGTYSTFLADGFGNRIGEVPEPASMSLLAMSAVGLLGRRRRAVTARNRSAMNAV